VVRYGAVELDLQGKPYLADDEPMRSESSCPWCPQAAYPQSVGCPDGSMANNSSSLNDEPTSRHRTSESYPRDPPRPEQSQNRTGSGRTA
jgi:hypothetical protein